MRKICYETPTQVIFVDVLDAVDCPTYRLIGGIAYGDVIICGECGGEISLEDLYEDYDVAAANGIKLPDAPIYELSWSPIDEAIAGDAIYEPINTMKEN